MDSREQIFREKYLKYKQKYLELKNDMEGGKPKSKSPKSPKSAKSSKSSSSSSSKKSKKCGVFSRPKTDLYEAKLRETVKSKFVIKIGDSVKKDRDQALSTVKPLLANLDKKLASKIIDISTKELCLTSAGKLFGKSSCPKEAKLANKLQELVKADSRIDVEVDGTKKDCADKKLFKEKKVSNEASIIDEIFKNAVKSVYPTVTVDGKDKKAIYLEIKDLILKTELKALYEQQIKDVQGLDQLKTNIGYDDSTTIEKAVEGIMKIVEQKKLNARCNKMPLLDVDTPSCTDDNIKFVEGLIKGLSDSETEYKNKDKELKTVEKAYKGNFSDKSKSPTVFRAEIQDAYKAAQEKVIKEKFGDESGTDLPFGEDFKIGNDKLKELVASKVNPAMTGGGEDSDLPDALTETPFM